MSSVPEVKLGNLTNEEQVEAHRLVAARAPYTIKSNEQLLNEAIKEVYERRVVL